MDKKLASYVQSTLNKGFTHEQVAERLRREGWPDEDIQSAVAAASRTHHARLIIVLAGFAAFLVLGILSYFFVIAPAFVEKPVLEQPALIAGMQPVDESHIAYVLNELGAYKLHANPFSGNAPEIEIFLTDTQQTYTAIVENNQVRVRKGPAQSPDVRVELTQDAVVFLASATDEDDFRQRTIQILSELEQRGYTARLLTDEKDLLLKGYLALYTEHKATVEAAGITGGAIVEFPLAGSGIVGLYVLVLLLWYIIIVRTALDR